MKLIVGLGNPGEKYGKTKHNLGFAVVEHLLKDLTSVNKIIWQKSNKFKSEIEELNVGSERIILAKPSTYMNNSGMAVKIIADFYKISTDNIWIVHDELDLPIGSMKIRLGGSSAGHNGVESVIESLGTDKFWRLRLGIGQEKTQEKMAKHNVKNAEDYVLSAFSPKDRGKIKTLIKHGAQALAEVLENGEDSAMNKFNTR